MFQELDLTGLHQSPGGDAQVADSHEAQSLPFDQADFERLAPDHQRWLLEGFLCAQDIARFRLGQELHDSTGQLVVALRLTLARIKAIGGKLATEDFFREIELDRRADREGDEGLFVPSLPDPIAGRRAGRSDWRIRERFRTKNRAQSQLPESCSERARPRIGRCRSSAGRAGSADQRLPPCACHVGGDLARPSTGQGGALHRG